MKKIPQNSTSAKKSIQQIVTAWGKTHALSPAHLKRMQIIHVTREEASQHLGYRAKAGGFLILYFDADGNATPMLRVRYDDYTDTWASVTGTEDAQKYAQPEKLYGVYFPPLGNKWRNIMADPARPIIITESELKAAAACAAEFDAVGLGGAWNFGSRKRGIALHREFEAFKWEGRSVYICYDSDAISNPHVMQAENCLAGRLVERGAKLFVVRLPAADGKGLDDFLVTHGAYGPEKLKALLAATEEWTLSRELHELNATYCYIRETSMVAELPTDGRADIRLYRPQVFAAELCANRKIITTVGDRTRILPAGKLWLESANRREVEKLTYRPGLGTITPDNELNLWQPFGMEQCEGDTGPWDELLAHLVPDSAERDWLECWFAAPLQQPGLKMAHAVTLWGGHEGTGKTLLGSTVGRIHGAANYCEITQAELCSAFNNWLVEKTFIQGSEVCGEKDSRAMADKLKTIITGETVAVNKKHQPLYTLQNVANFFFTSNHENAVFIGEHARRFAVFHVAAEPLPAKFYAAYARWLNNGGLAAIYYRLLHKRLSNFDAKGHALKTAARESMIDANRSNLQSWAHELRTNADTLLTLPPSVETIAGRFFTTKQLLAFYSGSDSNKVTEKGMAMALRAEGFKVANDGGLIRIPGTDLRLRLWIVRDALRAANMSAGQIGAEYARQIGAGEGMKICR